MSLPTTSHADDHAGDLIIDVGCRSPPRPKRSRRLTAEDQGSPGPARFGCRADASTLVARMDTASDPLRMRRLLDAGRALVGELDPHAVLDRILAAAREVTGARYAALAILDEHGESSSSSASAWTGRPRRHRRPAQRPRPPRRALEESRPLRLADVGDHPRSIGVPPGHPAMRSFLGVPILHRDAACGGLT